MRERKVEGLQCPDCNRYTSVVTSIVRATFHCPTCNTEWRVFTPAYHVVGFDWRRRCWFKRPQKGNPTKRLHPDIYNRLKSRSQ